MDFVGKIKSLLFNLLSRLVRMGENIGQMKKLTKLMPPPQCVQAVLIVMVGVECYRLYG